MHMTHQAKDIGNPRYDEEVFDDVPLLTFTRRSRRSAGRLRTGSDFSGLSQRVPSKAMSMRGLSNHMLQISPLSAMSGLI